MPRVSQEHLDARRRQILDAARVCFIRNGFHATSMQDVFKEAGLSAGAVYRYFRSKNEIIAAIAETKIGSITGALDELTADELPPLEEAFGAVFTEIQAANEREGIAKLVGQVASEAIRSPEVKTVMRRNVGEALDRMTRVVKLYQEAGVLAADVPPEKIARGLAAILQGFMLQLTIFDDIDADDFKLAVRGLVGGHVRSPG